MRFNDTRCSTRFQNFLHVISYKSLSSIKHKNSETQTVQYLVHARIKKKKKKKKRLLPSYAKSHKSQANTEKRRSSAQPKFKPFYIKSYKSQSSKRKRERQPKRSNGRCLARFTECLFRQNRSPTRLRIPRFPAWNPPTMVRDGMHARVRATRHRYERVKL